MNLLPEKIKDGIRSNYNKRLFTAVIFFCFILLVLGMIPLVVSYITTSYQITFLRQELAMMEKANKVDGVLDNLSIINDVNNKINILNKAVSQGPKKDISKILLAVVDIARSIEDDAKKPMIHLTSFSYGQIVTKKGQTKMTNYVINIGGVADRRDVLLDFVKRLESDKTFSSVDLPIANLVESTNAAFSLQLTLNNK